MSFFSAEAFNAYSDIIGELLDSLDKDLGLVENKRLFQYLMALYYLSNAKEMAAWERSTLVRILTKDKMEKEEEVLWKQALKSFKLYEEEFMVNAPESVVRLYKEIVKEEPMLPFRNALESKREGFGLKPEEWVKVSTERIGAIRKVEEALEDYVIEEAMGLKKAAVTKGVALLLVSVGVFLAVLISLLKTSKRITSSVNEILKVVSSTVETGRFNSRLREEGGDEFARIAKVFNQLMELMSRVVEDIKDFSRSASEGDFSKTIKLDPKVDLRVIKESLNSLLQTLNAVVKEVEGVMRAVY